jgi:adenine-specific DNA-methyltransferase
MISPDDPRLTGRFYTPPGVADLVLELARRGPGDTVWDPTCGEGVFLRCARRRGHPAARLFGTDLDGDALGRVGVEGATLQAVDVFKLEPSDLPPMDAIVGNPPFVRVERLDPGYRAWVQGRVAEGLGFAPPAQADLSTLVLLHCARFLADGGRLAFVLPATFLEADSAAPVRRWLLEELGLRAVVESRREPWFPAVRLNTVVVVLERGQDEATFAQLRVPASGAAAHAVLGLAEADVERRTLPRDELTAFPRWSEPLRAPQVWFDVLRDGRGLRPLRAWKPPFLELKYGTKPGISEFFAPRGRGLAEAGVEPAFRRPFVRSLRDVDAYTVRAGEVETELLHWDGDDPSADAAPGLHRWIRRGGRRRTAAGVRWPQVKSVAQNRPWYRLRRVEVGDVLIPQFRAARHAVHRNPEGVAVNNSAWWGRFTDPAWAEVGAALLNTSWTALAFEVCGRVNLGEGLLTAYGPDLQRLPLPHPRRFVGTAEGGALLEAWASMRDRRVLAWADEIEQDDRRALDAAFLGALGLPGPGVGTAVRAGALRLLEDRTSLAGALRDSRRSSRSS